MHQNWWDSSVKIIYFFPDAVGTFLNHNKQTTTVVPCPTGTHLSPNVSEKG
jgi:hypothetical protein